MASTRLRKPVMKLRSGPKSLRPVARRASSIRASASSASISTAMRHPFLNRWLIYIRHHFHGVYFYWTEQVKRNHAPPPGFYFRSEEHTSELQSLMRISYAVFCLKKKINKKEKLH